LLFWALALWALVRERWLLAGLAAGLALLAKYPGVLLAVAFLAAALRLRRLPKGAWLTAGLAALLLLPVVLWNAGREWVGFAFQLNHGLGGSGGWRTLGEYLGGQLAMGGPVLVPLAVVWAVRGPREQVLLRMATAVPLLVFGWASWRTRGEANWPAVAYLSACVGVAGMRPVWQRMAAVSALVVVGGVGLHVVVPLVTVERDVVLSRTHGWGPLARLAEAGKLFPGGKEGPVAAVYAPSYQLASQAAYYARLPADTAGPSRRSQYDVWPAVAVGDGEDALWVSEGEGPPEVLAGRFGSVEGPVVLPGEYRGRVLHTFHVWRLRGARVVVGDVAQ
ncbi:MAG: 4-amino-4-deoxy-L-arabinose transferase, partial [Myxococcaceae bacterium]|nr:4-amino-4-deoxy-L-arabinose transferase [Myxococcaceae bacterium]